MNELFAALVKAQAAVLRASKDSTNPAFRSKYSDLTSIWDAVRGPFTENGLCVIQCPSLEDGKVSVKTIVGHTSGQSIESTLYIPVGAKGDAHAVGSAITYGRRFSLASIAGVAFGEDDDGNAASAKADHKPAPPAQDDAKAAYKAIKAEVEAAVAAKDGKLLGELRTRLLNTPGVPLEPREALRKTINDCLDILVKEKNQ